MGAVDVVNLGPGTLRVEMRPGAAPVIDVQPNNFMPVLGTDQQAMSLLLRTGDPTVDLLRILAGVKTLRLSAQASYIDPTNPSAAEQIIFDYAADTDILTFSPDVTFSGTVNISGAVTIPDGSITAAMLADPLAGLADGLGMLRVARATYNPSATTGMRTVAPYGLGVTIPDKSIILGGFYQVNTTFTSAADSATIALSANSANDLVTAVAISDGTNPWDAGLHVIIPVIDDLTKAIPLTAARELTATVAVQALTAGKLTLFVYYVQGA
jgi:hypothetical protein